MLSGEMKSALVMQSGATCSPSPYARPVSTWWMVIFSVFKKNTNTDTNTKSNVITHRHNPKRRHLIPLSKCWTNFNMVDSDIIFSSP